jgi:hypothetical protein
MRATMDFNISAGTEIAKGSFEKADAAQKGSVGFVSVGGNRKAKINLTADIVFS